MSTLTLRNLPDDVHARLKERAKRNHRSVNQEIVAILASPFLPESEGERLEQARERMRAASARIDALRSRTARFMTPEEIDAARKEGRA
jgi:plasmid stability protein